MLTASIALLCGVAFGASEVVDRVGTELEGAASQERKASFARHHLGPKFGPIEVEAMQAPEAVDRDGTDLEGVASGQGKCTIAMLQEAGALDKDLGLPAEYPKKVLAKLRETNQCNRCAHSCWQTHADFEAKDMEWLRKDGMEGEASMRACTMKCVTVKNENADCTMEEYSFSLHPNPAEIWTKMSMHCGTCMKKCAYDTPMKLRPVDEFKMCLGCCSGIEIASHFEGVPSSLEGKTCESANFITPEPPIRELEPLELHEMAAWVRENARKRSTSEPEEKKAHEKPPPPGVQAGIIILVVVLTCIGVAGVTVAIKYHGLKEWCCYHHEYAMWRH